MFFPVECDQYVLDQVLYFLVCSRMRRHRVGKIAARHGGHPGKKFLIGDIVACETLNKQVVELSFEFLSGIQSEAIVLI